MSEGNYNLEDKKKSKGTVAGSNIEKYNSTKNGGLLVAGSTMIDKSEKNHNNQTFNSDVEESPSMKGINTINMVIIQNYLIFYIKSKFISFKRV